MGIIGSIEVATVSPHLYLKLHLKSLLFTPHSTLGIVKQIFL